MKRKIVSKLLLVIFSLSLVLSTMLPVFAQEMYCESCGRTSNWSETVRTYSQDCGRDWCISCQRYTDMAYDIRSTKYKCSCGNVREATSIMGMHCKVCMAVQ